MRIRADEFQNEVKHALGDKPGLSADFEAGLFARAEDLLAVKRERLELRRTSAKHLARKKFRLPDKILDRVALRPDIPAAATALAVLLFAFLALHNGPGRRISLTYADLPEFPKYNDAPARYDAQRLAEQNAYEREVENAHRETSGGI